jgi:hypothetical protein
LDECKVVGRELVVASCDTPRFFDLVEEPLDQIAGAILADMIFGMDRHSAAMSAVGCNGEKMCPLPALLG